jgi:hypothetical protein
MPVFKIKKDGAWQEVAGVSGNLHNYAGSSSAGGAANSVANALSIQIIGGDLSGSDISSSTMSEFIYDGSKAQSVKVANATHTHSSYETFVVTVTGNDTDGYVADKTYTEIKAMLADGVDVVAKIDVNGAAVYGQLTMDTGAFLVFSCSTSVGDRYAVMTCTISTNDAVTVTMPSNEEVESAVTAVSAVKDGSTVTVTATYADDSTAVTVIALDENGDPVSVTKDGVTTTLSWEGFDEA